MSRLRIAIVTPTFPPKSGGIATSHYNLFHLLRGSHDVQAFAFADGDRTPHPDVVRSHTPKWQANLLERAFRTYLRRYDRTCGFPNCSRIARCSIGARRLSGPLRTYRPDVILVPDHFLPTCWLHKPAGCKIVWYCHNNYRRFRGHPLLTGHSWADIDVASSMERRALRKADAVISPSEYMLGEFDKSFGNLPVDRRVIHNFLVPALIDAVPRFDIRNELALADDVPIVCIPSAGTDNKGKRYVFEIVRRVTTQRNGHVAFYLSGHIPDDLSFELSHVSPAATIYAPGHVVWQDNVARVKSCDLCVSPTLVENFSNALVEVMWCGLPVVTFDVGGNREIVTSDKNGYIVDYLDVNELVQRTISLIENETQREQFGGAAAEDVQRRLCPEAVLPQYAQFFEDLMA